MGTRGRQLSSDDEGPSQDEVTKRATTQPTNQPSSGHYDIYAIPSITPPHPSLSSPSFQYQSLSLLVVNRAAGLSSGLGILYALASADSPSHPALVPHRDAGFFLGREPSFNPAGAVLLGWVEEERLAWLDGVVAASRVPRLASGTGQGLVGCTREWLLELLGRLEMEGVLSNPELLVAHFFRAKYVEPEPPWLRGLLLI